MSAHLMAQKSKFEKMLRILQNSRLCARAEWDLCGASEINVYAVSSEINTDLQCPRLSAHFFLVDLNGEGVAADATILAGRVEKSLRAEASVHVLCQVSNDQLDRSLRRFVQVQVDVLEVLGNPDCSHGLVFHTFETRDQLVEYVSLMCRLREAPPDAYDAPLFDGAERRARVYEKIANGNRHDAFVLQDSFDGLTELAGASLADLRETALSAESAETIYQILHPREFQRISSQRIASQNGIKEEHCEGGDKEEQFEGDDSSEQMCEH